MTMTRIALAQMTSGIDPDANLADIAHAADTAKAGGAAMLFLPEMSLLLDRDRARSAAAITAEGASPWIPQLADMARRNGIWLHIGSAPFTADEGTGRVNRSLLFDPGGQIVARYDKVHMFDVDLPTGESWRESALYQGGEELVCTDTAAGRLGHSICYDLRFPELYATLTQDEATLIAIPAAFTAPTGAAHWHVLLRARAIETACYIVAAAQVGTHADGRQTYGHSLVVDPWGAIVAEATEPAPTLIFADLDSKATAKARSAIPLARSRQSRRWQP
jgi:deaminated glutathione amidase